MLGEKQRGGTGKKKQNVELAFANSLAAAYAMIAIVLILAVVVGNVSPWIIILIACLLAPGAIIAFRAVCLIYMEQRKKRKQSPT